jgi:hypothetical protein
MEANIKPEKYEENLEKIISICQDSCKCMFWISSTPVDNSRHNSCQTSFFRFNEDIIKYNEIAYKLMYKNKIPVIDLYLFTLSLGKDLYRDHIHFRQEISIAQAAFIAGHVIARCS